MNALKDYVDWKLTHSDKTTEAEGYPLILEKCKKNKKMKDLKVYGNSVQNGTPTPENPVEVQSVGELVTDENDENFGKYKISVAQSGKNLFKPTVVSCSAYTNINNAIDNNSYGTKIDSTDLSDNIVKINQVYNDQYSSDNYRNGFIIIGTGGNLKVNQSYVLSFDIEIPENSRITSVITIQTNGNSSYFNATLKKETRQRVNAVVKMSELRGNYPQHIEIRCMGMSFTASNFMITEVGFDAEFEPYSEPITHNVFLEQPLADGEVLDVKEHIPLPKLTAKTTVFTTDTTTPPSKMYAKYIKR